jgi:hypothetical protein
LQAGKKRLISTIKLLPRLVLLNIAACIVAFIIISVYPIANYFVTIKLEDTLKSNGKLKKSNIIILIILFITTTKVDDIISMHTLLSTVAQQRGVLDVTEILILLQDYELLV